jgi:hypothetical protein
MHRHIDRSAPRYQREGKEESEALSEVPRVPERLLTVGLQLRPVEKCAGSVPMVSLRLWVLVVGAALNVDADTMELAGTVGRESDGLPVRVPCGDTPGGGGQKKKKKLTDI